MKISLPIALLFAASMNGINVLANNIRNSNKNNDSTKLWTDNTKKSDEARRLSSKDKTNGKRLRNNSKKNNNQQREDVVTSVDMKAQRDTIKRVVKQPGAYDSEKTIGEERRELSQHRAARPASDIGYRIIGGDQAEIGEFPYYVDLFGCGGSLIAPNAVLTAGHCSKFRGEEVIVGGYQRINATYGAEVRTVVSEVTHPDFDRSTAQWDFKLLRLDSPVNKTTPIGLRLNNLAEMPFDGERLTVLGQGLTSTEFSFDNSNLPDFLQDVHVYAINSDECSNNTVYEGKINDECMFCAGVNGGGKDACGGDSGGPIVVRDDIFHHIQVGVVSWGHGCGEAGSPGVYSRVSSAYTWIQDIVCGEWRGTGHLCDDYVHNYDPAPSPGNDTTCVDLEIDLLTDDDGKDVDIILFDDVTGGLLWNKRDFLNNETYHFNACVQKDGCYTLDVYDTMADGLANPGYIEAKFDGKEQFKMNEYGLRLIHQFGSGCEAIVL